MGDRAILELDSLPGFAPATYHAAEGGIPVSTVVRRFRVVIAAALFSSNAIAGVRPSAVLADCAVGAFCVEIEADHGRPGDVVEATVQAPCADLTTAAIEFVGHDPGGTAPLQAEPAGGEARFRFVVPKVAAGHYRLFFSCRGFEAWELAVGFDVMTGAPDTSTATPAPERSETPLPAVFLLALGALGAALGWSRTSRRRADPVRQRRGYD